MIQFTIFLCVASSVIIAMAVREHIQVTAQAAKANRSENEAAIPALASLEMAVEKLRVAVETHDEELKTISRSIERLQRSNQVLAFVNEYKSKDIANEIWTTPHREVDSSMAWNLNILPTGPMTQKKALRRATASNMLPGLLSGDFIESQVGL